jgi:hypothetical protein
VTLTKRTELKLKLKKAESTNTKLIFKVSCKEIYGTNNRTWQEKIPQPGQPAWAHTHQGESIVWTPYNLPHIPSITINSSGIRSES